MGDVHFICDIISPEDLAVVPGEEWIIASGDQEGGRIHLVNIDDYVFVLASRSSSIPDAPRIPIAS